MTLKYDLFKTNHLVNLDLVNLYRLKSSRNVPAIQKVLIELPLANCIKNSDKSNVIETNLDIQIKAFSFLYLYSSNIPFIRSKVNVSGKTTTNFFLLKLLVNKSLDIHNFLTSLFVENWSGNLKEEVFSGKLLNNSDSVYTFKIPQHSLFESENILNNSISDITSKDLYLNFSIVVKQKPNFSGKNMSFLKNLPLFWKIS
jgi:hypothetical protein